ncbi:MAG: gliding motility-associated C-terminal domain-containing protein [Flavobacteriales bacterium]|nr:gliding motility-associated C-terminal domain-containing protein [Flavobacteriales bacterium]
MTSEFGCLDTAYHQVIIDPDLLIYVPNAFTPDGDGVNDVFLPSLDGFVVRDYNLTIWDRWGQPIFETRMKAHLGRPGQWHGKRSAGWGVRVADRAAGPELRGEQEAARACVRTPLN